MNIEEFEKYKKMHIVFFYNNIYRGNDSFIDNLAVEELYKVFSYLNKYDKLNLVIETGGGNLAAGARLIHLINNLYKEYEVTVLNRCSSTGTLIALGASKINILPKSLITPCEPQIEVNGNNISISLLRNILENTLSLQYKKNDLDFITIGKYYSSINYFKDLCNALYDSNKAELIIDYMLNKVNSHQYPISIKELNNIHGNLNIITDSNELNFYEEQDSVLKDNFLDLIKDDIKETHLTLIRDRYYTRSYCKKYKKSNELYHKISEGYKVI